MTDEKLLCEVRERAKGMHIFNTRWLVLELANRYEKAQAEIERLEHILDKRCDMCPAVMTAIKEFAEQVEKALLNKKLLCREDIPVIINNILKETTER